MRRVKASPATIEELLAVSRMVDRRNPPQYCGLPTCARDRIGRNLCRAHYLQLYKWAKKTGTTLDRTYSFEDLSDLAQPVKGMALTSSKLACVVCGDRIHARGFCYSHYLTWWRGEERKKEAA